MNILSFKNSLSKEITAAAEPKWNQLFVQGTFYRQDFPEGITLDIPAFEKMVENWKAAGRPELCVDYFHWGASNVTQVPIEEKVASGWIKRLRVRNGVLEGLIAWTDKARAKIEAQELKYFSPYFQMDGLDRSTGKTQGPTLFGGGLLNDPFLTTLPAVAASAAPPTPETAKQQEQQVNPKLMKAVCAALGIPEASTEEEVMAAAMKLAAPPVVEEKKEEKKEEVPAIVATVAPSATPAPIAASATATISSETLALAVEPVRIALAAAVAQSKELGLKIEKLESEKAEAKTIALTEKLFSQGRLLPASRDVVAKMVKAIGHDEAEKYFSAMPVIVDLKERGIASDGTPVNAKIAFEAIIDGIAAKENIKRSAARELAIAQNRELALAAHRNS